MSEKWENAYINADLDMPWVRAILEVCQREKFPHTHYHPETGEKIIHDQLYPPTNWYDVEEEE